MNADDWVYLGEGNQNLVVRYVGENPEYTGKVLRVIKGSKYSHPNSSLFKQQFIDKVIKPLLGEEYVLTLWPITTSKAFLTQLAANVESKRPESRLSGRIDTNVHISFLMDDLTNIWPNLPTLTFELKPKWGFKPHNTGFSIKRQYCRFCMHSHLRNAKLYGYCPLDLYSQDPEREKKALTILLKEHSLNKTLRVSGTPLDTDEDTIQEILTKILLQDPILSKLKNLQETLDELDVETIYPLYENIKNTLNINTTDINVWDGIVKQYQQRQKHKGVTDVSTEQRILEYVLSMTFKDCSIMINVAPSDQNTNKCITVSRDKHFQYDIKVIDTDLKSIEKIPYWYELDQSIVKYAIDTNFHKLTDCQ